MLAPIVIPVVYESLNPEVRIVLSLMVFCAVDPLLLCKPENSAVEIPENKALREWDRIGGLVATLRSDVVRSKPVWPRCVVSLNAHRDQNVSVVVVSSKCAYKVSLAGERCRIC